MHIHRKFWFDCFFQNFVHFEFKNLTKMKDITETVCKHNSLKPLNRISWNFVVMKLDAHIHRKFRFHFFLRVTPFFNLEIWSTWKILLNSLSPQLLWNRSTEFCETLKLWKTYCKCAYPQEILIPFCYSELRPFWN